MRLDVCEKIGVAAALPAGVIAGCLLRMLHPGLTASDALRLGAVIGALAGLAIAMEYIALLSYRAQLLMFGLVIGLIGGALAAVIGYAIAGAVASELGTVLLTAILSLFAGIYAGRLFCYIACARSPNKGKV